MANIYKKLGQNESFLQMVNEACDYANTKNYVEQLDSLMSMRLTGEYVQMAKDLPLNNHTLSEIEALLEKSSIAMQNKDMRNQMDFISIWQNVIEINNRTTEELINTAANSFFCKAYY